MPRSTTVDTFKSMQRQRVIVQDHRIFDAIHSDKFTHFRRLTVMGVDRTFPQSCRVPVPGPDGGVAEWLKALVC